MDFRKYANRETTELVGRLVTGASDKVASDLQALRQAFDAVTGALDTALASQAAPEFAEEVGALADRLAAEAGARAEAAGADARRQAQASIDELRAALEQARAERTATGEELRAAREQLGAARDEASRAGAQRDAEAGRSEKLSAALSAVTTELQDTKAQNKTLLERNSALAAELEAFTKRSAADLAALKKSAAADIEALKKSSEEHERAARALQDKLDAAQGRLDAALREAESRQAQRAADEHRATCDRAATFFETSLDRLMALYVSSSDDATTEGALNAMVEAMSAQFPRVALFRVQGNRLEGVRHVGFDLQSDISQVLIPRNLDSLATQAVASARIETRSGTNLADTTGMPFGGSPQFALALPLVMDGEPVAVLYADDADQADRDFARPDTRIKYAELLRQQALPLLERAAARARIAAELDEYAALLLTELEQTYAAEIASAGDLSETDRRKNLRENIDYARRLYAERAGPEGSRVASLFEQRLVAAVEGAADTPFGRDIAGAIGARRRAARAVAPAGAKHSAAS